MRSISTIRCKHLLGSPEVRLWFFTRLHPFDKFVSRVLVQRREAAEINELAICNPSRSILAVRGIVVPVAGPEPGDVLIPCEGVRAVGCRARRPREQLSLANKAVTVASWHKKDVFVDSDGQAKASSESGLSQEFNYVLRYCGARINQAAAEGFCEVLV